MLGFFFLVFHRRCVLKFAVRTQRALFLPNSQKFISPVALDGRKRQKTITKCTPTVFRKLCTNKNRDCLSRLLISHSWGGGGGQGWSAGAGLIRQSKNMADGKVYGTTKSGQLEGKGGGTTDPRCGFRGGVQARIDLSANPPLF